VRGLRARLLDVAAEQAGKLGFDPALRFTGLLDTLPDDLAEDLRRRRHPHHPHPGPRAASERDRRRRR